MLKDPRVVTPLSQATDEMVVAEMILRIWPEARSSHDLMKDTPSRVVRSWRELYRGYLGDPADLFRTFDVPTDEMVVVKDIEFWSTGEHHLLPFFGKAHVGYVQDGKVVGLSKLARVVEAFARRLQVQERLTQQVRECIDLHLKALGTAVVLEAKHLCMVCRGVGKQQSTMVTSSLSGVFKDEPETRAEFLQFVRG